jgi:hypothetical protein
MKFRICAALFTFLLAMAGSSFEFALAQGDPSAWNHEVHSFRNGGQLSVDYNLVSPVGKPGLEMTNIWINASGSSLSPQDVIDAEFRCEWTNGRETADPSRSVFSLLYNARNNTFTAPAGSLSLLWEGRTGARAYRLCEIFLLVNGAEVLRTDSIDFKK